MLSIVQARSAARTPAVGAAAHDEGAKAIATTLLAAGLANGNRLPELLSVLAAVALVLLGRKLTLATTMRIVAPLLALLGVGAVVTILTGHLGLDALRAAYYVLRVPVWLGLGIALVVHFRDIRVPLNALMLAAVGLSVYFIGLYVTSPEIVAQGRYVLRTELAGGWLILPLGAAAAVYALITQPRISAAGALWLGTVVVLAAATIVLSQSRTALVAGGMVFIGMAGLIPFRLYAWGVVPVIYAALFVLTTPILSMLLSVDLVSLLDYSAPAVLREVLALDRTAAGDINSFWRGYETFSAYNFVQGQGLWNTVFGTGLHSVVPLRELMLLQGSTYAGIPVFHSLFSFAFVRAGVIGIILIGLQHVVLALPLQRLALSPIRQFRLLGRYGCGLHLAMLLSVPTTAGFLNQGEGGSTPLLALGLIIGCSLLVGQAHVAKGLGSPNAAAQPRGPTPARFAWRGPVSPPSG